MLSHLAQMSVTIVTVNWELIKRCECQYIKVLQRDVCWSLCVPLSIAGHLKCIWKPPKQLKPSLGLLIRSSAAILQELQQSIMVVSMTLLL